MNTQKFCGSAAPTQSCRVARPKGEGAASSAKRVIVISAARCFNLPCWASRSSRGYPLREAEQGVRKSLGLGTEPVHTVSSTSTGSILKLVNGLASTPVHQYLRRSQHTPRKPAETHVFRLPHCGRETHSLTAHPTQPHSGCWGGFQFCSLRKRFWRKESPSK